MHSYNSLGVWHNVGPQMQKMDWDICFGNADGGIYHRKFQSVDNCLSINSFAACIGRLNQ